jgi:hypothetical protein
MPECTITAGTAAAPDTINIVLSGKVVPQNAPMARNSSESLLFRQLYETLININCLGEIVPGLAESWTSSENGRRWTFTLREGALFWDDTSVVSKDIITSWSILPIKIMAFTAGIDSVTLAGDRAIHVYVDRPHQSPPGILAALELAVVKRTRDSRWPLGTGFYKTAVRDPGDVLYPDILITTRSDPGSNGPVFKFIETSVSDTRDLLEGDVDMMVTSDPAVIEYANSRQQLAVTPLPWDKTYLLLSTSRVQELRRGGELSGFLEDLADELARNAVRGDARGYEPPSWWDELDECGGLYRSESGPPPLPMGAYTTSGMRRILYDQSDPIARGLAERIVALAGTDPITSPGLAELNMIVPGMLGDPGRTISEGVTWDELGQSLKNGQDFAYIFQVQRRPSDPCYEARVLISRARWLAPEETDFSDALIPLVDTRRYVITSRDRVGLSFNWNGDILLDHRRER